MVSRVDMEASRLLGVSAGLASLYPVTVEHDWMSAMYRAKPLALSGSAAVSSRRRTVPATGCVRRAAGRSGYCSGLGNQSCPSFSQAPILCEWSASPDSAQSIAKRRDRRKRP